MRSLIFALALLLVGPLGADAYTPEALKEIGRAHV